MKLEEATDSYDADGDITQTAPRIERLQVQ